ncbi:MAG: hypothetical protein U0746_19040 [Gemmataceae bacterium]
MTPETRRELLSLLSALCDGELAVEGRDRLQRLLASDPECRRVYLEYVDTHARLLTHPQPGGSAAKATPANPPKRRASQILHYAAVSFTTMAATLLLQVALAPEPSRVGPIMPVASRTRPYIATLTQASGCEWENTGETWRVGARLVPGRLKLKAGVAEVRFDSGSDLILQGPAELRLETTAAATLLAGKVVFRATATGTPFDLRTPSSRLVDFGTEYAVSVGPHGEEVHVFDGEVERTGHGAPESLKAGAAMRFDGGEAGRPTPLNPTAFVRAVAVPNAPAGNVAGLLAYEGFDYAEADALAAGRANGGSGWAGPWQMAFARPQPPDIAPKLFAPAGLTRTGAMSPAVGGAFDFTGFTKLFRRLAEPVRLDRDGMYYLSYLFRRQGPATDQTNAVAVLLWTDADQKEQGSDPRSRLNVGVGGPAHELFTHLHGVNSRTPVPLAYGETYLMVAKIVASAAHPDQVFMRVYGPGEPVGTTEPGSWTVVGPPFESDLTFNWLQAHVNSSARQTLDEIRLGTTWASVTAAWAAPAK